MLTVPWRAVNWRVRGSTRSSLARFPEIKGVCGPICCINGSIFVVKRVPNGMVAWSPLAKAPARTNTVVNSAACGSSIFRVTRASGNTPAFWIRVSNTFSSLKLPVNAWLMSNRTRVSVSRRSISACARRCAVASAKMTTPPICLPCGSSNGPALMSIGTTVPSGQRTPASVAVCVPPWVTALTNGNCALSYSSPVATLMTS